MTCVVNSLPDRESSREDGVYPVYSQIEPNNSVIKLHALVGSVTRIEMYVLIWDGTFSTKQWLLAQACLWSSQVGSTMKRSGEKAGESGAAGLAKHF